MTIRDGLAVVILAGGEGTRLRALTRHLAGDDRPKQFCRVLGGETLLEQTRRRARRLAEPAAILIVVTRAHEPYYLPEFLDAPAGTVVEQPDGRGTAPAILYALLRLRRTRSDSTVILLPSDHWISDDDAFMARVAGAVEAAREQPDRAVLLGIAPDRPERQYGWIEPGELLPGRSWPLFRVRRFCEKPDAASAERLFRRRCLWNSFVTVGHRATLERMLATAAPSLARAFAPFGAAIGTPGEAAAARAAYAGLAAVDFSRDVLQHWTDGLAVLPVTGVQWNDLGDPARVEATRASIRRAGLPRAVVTAAS